MKSIRLHLANHVVFALLLIAFAVSQLFFLKADPDISMATGSRAAWTDDGILLCQVRNLLNGHGFQLMESDGFLKAPVFSAIQGLSMAVFGCEQVVSRVTVLCMVLLASFMIYSQKFSRVFSILIVLTTLSLIPVHQHAHLALAEMAAASFVLIAGVCLVRYFQEPKVVWILLSQVAVVFAIGTKIQFLYLMILPWLCWFIVTKTNASDRKCYSNHLMYLTSSVFISGALFLIYYLAFKHEWHVFQRAQSGSLLWDALSWDSFRNNCMAYLFRKKMILFVALFFISLGFFCKILFDNKCWKVLSVWSIFSFSWFVLELHKLPMDYLPMRYMVSFYISMGLFSCAVMSDVWLCGLFPRFKTLTLGLVAVVFLVNASVLFKAFNDRTYVLSSIQKRVGSGLKNEDVIVGPWAPAFSWGSGCRSFPVWNGFSNSGQIYESGSPTVIVTENGGIDSDFDWSGFLGDDLDAVADSVTRTSIADWQVGVYWLK